MAIKLGQRLVFRWVDIEMDMAGIRPHDKVIGAGVVRQAEDVDQAGNGDIALVFILGRHSNAPLIEVDMNNDMSVSASLPAMASPVQPT